MPTEVFIEELQQIQVELASGLSALGVIQDALDEQSAPPAPADALHVVRRFLQDVYDQLERSLRACV